MAEFLLFLFLWSGMVFFGGIFTAALITKIVFSWDSIKPIADKETRLLFNISAPGLGVFLLFAFVWIGMA